MIVMKHNDEEAAKKAIEERKKAMESEHAETLKIALGICLCPTGLTVPDLKYLLPQLLMPLIHRLRRGRQNYNNNCIVSHDTTESRIWQMISDLPLLILVLLLLRI